MSELMKRKKKNWHERGYLVLELYPFKVQVLVFIDPTEDYFKKKLKKLIGKNYEKFNEDEINGFDKETSTRGRMIPFMGGFIILVRVNKNDFREFVGTLTHEIMHAVHYALRDRRIPLNEDTEEVYTYSTEYLLTETLKALY